MSAYDWDPLKNTVQGAIDRGQIGKPKALRMTVHALGGPSEQKELASALRCLAQSWFGDAGESEYTIGSEGSPALTALKWNDGRSAMIAVSAGAGRTSGNLMLMGSNGTLYHEVRMDEEGDA